MLNKCHCGTDNWEWSIDARLRSWIKCKDCGDSMFPEGIGVILINWDVTDIYNINIEDVLRSNIDNEGVVEEI